MKSFSLDRQLYIDIFQKIDFEKIIDHPNILIAANFWDEDRYQAAKTCYKFMRSIDDLIDNYKSEHKTIVNDEKKNLEADVTRWISYVLKNADSDSTSNELIETFRKFCIPVWPMQDFAISMVYDIYHDGFPSLNEFLVYAVGASVAPASIFVHLCGLKKENGRWLTERPHCSSSG